MTSHRSRNLSRAALLAAAVTGLAALAAWVLSSVVHLSEPAVVISVMVTAFCASWFVTNHPVSDRRHVHHRTSFMPLHSRAR